MKDKSKSVFGGETEVKRTLETRASPGKQHGNYFWNMENDTRGSTIANSAEEFRSKCILFRVVRGTYFNRSDSSCPSKKSGPVRRLLTKPRNTSAEKRYWEFESTVHFELPSNNQCDSLEFFKPSWVKWDLSVSKMCQTKGIGCEINQFQFCKPPTPVSTSEELTLLERHHENSTPAASCAEDWGEWQLDGYWHGVFRASTFVWRRKSERRSPFVHLSVHTYTSLRDPSSQKPPPIFLRNSSRSVSITTPTDTEHAS
jgi:hypothetical protein